MVALSQAPNSGAATTIGHTDVPGGNCGNVTWLQTNSIGFQYAVPSPGVITRWSTRADLNPSPIKLKVGRPSGGAAYRIIGESGLHIPAPAVTSSFDDVRIPVQTGDVVGLFMGNSGSHACVISAALADSYVGETGDVVPSATPTTFNDFSGDGYLLNISAVVEPDADGDGYGDETQDGCPTDASVSGPCPDRIAPDTRIDEGPLKKSKRRQAKIAFSSNEAGTSFECKLDLEPFDPCSSPLVVKVARGKHQVQVRAVDAAGNVDGSPASYRWKVKRKRR